MADLNLAGARAEVRVGKKNTKGGETLFPGLREGGGRERYQRQYDAIYARANSLKAESKSMTRCWRRF